MSKPTELTALKMQVFALEREKCAACNHTLGAHKVTQRAPDAACTSFDPMFGRLVYCKCRRWVDAEEMLDLDA